MNTVAGDYQRLPANDLHLGLRLGSVRLIFLQIISRDFNGWQSIGFDSKYNFWNFQKPKIKLKKDPLMFQKIKNIYKEASIKKFYKTDPPKVGIMI